MAVDVSAVVIVIDGLAAGLLGSYGNAWLPTPATDRLASQSTVIEFPWIESLDRDAFADSVFFGRHACCPPRGKEPGLAALLTDRQVDTVILTDHEPLADHPGVGEFRDGELLVGHVPTRAAEEMESTMAATFLATCAERLTKITRPSLVWIQFHGLLTCWDAPLEWRHLVTDETDPSPPVGVAPIERLLAPEDDPDIALGAMQNFAAQVAVVDACLSMLLDAVDQWMDSRATMVVLTSSQGFALGEHSSIGGAPVRPHSELFHVPLIVRTPSSIVQPQRCPVQAQPVHLFGTLADWFGLPCDRRSTGAVSLIDGAVDHGMFSRAVTLWQNGMALRVPAWLLLTGPTGEGSQTSDPGDLHDRLFAKPDDRWDANDIADLCPDAVALMREQLYQFQAAAQRHQLDHLPELPRELTRPHR